MSHRDRHLWFRIKKDTLVCLLVLYTSEPCVINLSRQGLSHLENENLGDDYEEESSSAGYHTDESCSPTPEPVVTGSGNCDVLVRENRALENPALADITVERLAERYGALHSQANLHTLDALDALESLKDAPDLKAKILYSVVVVSVGKVKSSR